METPDKKYAISWIIYDPFICRQVFKPSPHDVFFLRILLHFSGQTKTMMGSMGGSTDLGAIPCAIAWLYKGINEKRQKTGSRFSVRVSALGVSATKPGSSARDLLAAHATGKFKIFIKSLFERVMAHIFVHFFLT